MFLPAVRFFIDGAGFTNNKANAEKELCSQPIILWICRRSPHGLRGLKCTSFEVETPYGAGRSPHGLRGLKSAAVKQ